MSINGCIHLTGIITDPTTGIDQMKSNVRVIIIYCKLQWKFVWVIRYKLRDLFHHPLMEKMFSDKVWANIRQDEDNRRDTVNRLV